MIRRGPVIVATLSALAVAALFVVPVPSQGVLLLVDRSGGSVRARSGPGITIRAPWSTRTVRIPGEPATLEATWRVAGRPVQVHLEAAPDPDGEPHLLLEMADGVQAYLEGAALDLRHEVLRGVAEVPGAALSELVRAGLESALARRSLLAVEVSVVAVPGVALPAPRDTGTNVLLVGLDAADWDLIDPMIESGRLPNLARLRSGGAWGTLRSDAPLLSPLLWTTVATGKPPDQHGVVDFVMIDPESGAPIPISSHFRRVKAFWNILTDVGLSVDVVGWWATWPAEPVEGVMVTDRVAYSLFEYDRRADARGATFPSSYLATAARLRMQAADLRWEQLRPLAAVTREEFDLSTRQLASATEATYHSSLNNLRRTLAGTLTYHAIALDLLRRAPPRLLAVYYQGLDEVNHRFAHLLPPVLELAEPGEVERFGGAIAAFYELQDRLLGELLGAAPPGTTVMVLSDHGFANRSERPLEFLPYIEAGLPGRWHTLDGIWILHGPPVQPGRLAAPVRLSQITPTLLRLMGLPLADDMERGPVDAGIRRSFLEAHDAGRIPTYEDGEQVAAAAAPQVSAADDQMLERLRSLGYLAPSGAAGGHGPGRGVTSANYHANLGSIYLGRGDPAAAAEFRRALELNPGQLSALGGLIQIDIMEGRDAAALDAILRLFDATVGYDAVYYYLAAELFRRTERTQEGLARFRELAAVRPEHPLVQTGLGILRQDSGDLSGAAAAYRAALDRKPDALFALQELYSLETASGDLGDLVTRLAAAIEAAPRAPLPYNWRGLVQRRLGLRSEAEASFRQALELEPDRVATLVNLSSLLVDEGRHQEAIPLLRRALDRDETSLEPRINLIVALGRARRLDGARAEFERAGELGDPSPALLNAMAFASYLNGAGDEARSLLERSLALQPGQEEALRLLDRLGGGG